MKEYNRAKTLKWAFRASVPVMAGYIFIGIGFGILMASHGYGPIWAAAMSLIIYAGSSQFVAVDLMVSSASLVTSALMCFMVNVRHLFYAISMVGSYNDTGKYKPYLTFSLTDETYALVCQLDLPDDVDKNLYCFALSLMNQIYWIGGSVLGGIVGMNVNFDFTGIDFAMTAMFVATATEQWIKTGNHWPAITGLVVSLVCLLIWGPDSFLIPTMLIIIIALEVEKKVGLLPDTISETDSVESEINVGPDAEIGGGGMND